MSDDDPDRARYPLEYRQSSAERTGRGMEVAGAVVAAILAAAGVFGVAASWIVSNLSLGGAPDSFQWRWPGVFTLTLAALLGLIGWVAWRKRRRLIVAGLLIGIGLGVLAQGLCWLTVVS